MKKKSKSDLLRGLDYEIHAYVHTYIRMLQGLLHMHKDTNCLHRYTYICMYVHTYTALQAVRFTQRIYTSICSN